MRPSDQIAKPVGLGWMSDDYLSSTGERVQAMRMDPELVTVISVWCHGNVIEEIDPFDNATRFPGINLRTREGVSRAQLGDYVIKHGDGTFEVKKPSAFIRNHIPE
jgi:hypothetical protein